LQLRAVKFEHVSVLMCVQKTQPIHLLYLQLMERDLAPDAGEVPAVFVVAQQAPDMQ